jgi:hypothetical protein
VHDDPQADQLAALGRRLVALGQGLGARRDVDRALATTRRADLATSTVIGELTRLVDRLETGGAATRPAVCGSHGVHFSRSHDHTVAAIIEMVDDARAVGRPAVVVATRVHRRWIEADLHQRCIAFEGDVCRLLDAETALASLLLDGEPDRDRFRSVVGGLLSDMCARHPGGVSVYGEMVGLLWSAGKVTAAMRLEELWTELQRELPFSLLCGYLIDRSPERADLDPIRHAHTYVA